MNAEDLLPNSYRLTADIAVNTIGDNQALFDEMMKIALQDKGPVSMRAARVIQLATEKYPELIKPHLACIIQALACIQTDGVKRSFARILMMEYVHLKEHQIAGLIDICFNWFANATEKVALRAYALEILYAISKAYPEIKSELIAIIEQVIPELDASLRKHSEKILRSLYQEAENKP